MKTYLSLFEFKGHGLWINEAENMSIVLDSAHRRTFTAHLCRRPEWRHVVVNEKGNPLRFRSAEAAAKHLLTDTN